MFSLFNISRRLSVYTPTKQGMKGLFSSHPHQQWELSLKKIFAKLIGKKWHLNLICISLITRTVERLFVLAVFTLWLCMFTFTSFQKLLCACVSPASQGRALQLRGAAVRIRGSGPLILLPCDLR